MTKLNFVRQAAPRHVRGRVLVVSGILFALGACGGVSVDVPSGGSGNGGGTCPCTVGNSGLSFTIGCGESNCLSLNGTETGYVCGPTGALTENPAICDSPPGVDAGARPRDAPLPDVVILPSPLDAGPTPPPRAIDGGCFPSADGGSGVCSSPTSCDCAHAEGCAFTCGSAGAPYAGSVINCAQVSSCEVSCAGNCNVNCGQTDKCTVQGGNGAYVGCGQVPACTATVGANASVFCNQADRCTATVGAGTTVSCAQADVCDVTCTGSCQVDCSQADSCKVVCPAGSTCAVQCDTVKSCPDGVTQVCGLAACPT